MDGRRKTYWSYSIAKAYAKNHKINSAEHWRKAIKGEIRNIPSTSYLPLYPYKVYIEWPGWEAFLGRNTKRRKKQFFSFEKAKEYAKKAGIQSRKDFYLWMSGKIKASTPPSQIMPYYPEVTYITLWKNWEDFFGVPERKKLSYQEAKEFFRPLKLSSVKDWREYKDGKREDLPPYPQNIPKAPDEYYRKKATWKGFVDFLSIEKVRQVNSLSFSKAKKLVRELNIKSKREYWAFIRGGLSRKKFPVPPKNLPRVPEKMYRSDWKGWGDFLGTGTVERGKKKYRSFEKAREFVRRLKIRSEKDWYLYTKGKLKGYDLMPKDIPMRPNFYYKEKWEGFNDFLGNGNEKGRIAPKFMSYKAAKKFASSLNLKSSKHWHKYALGKMANNSIPEFPLNIPKNPFRSYQNKGWISWGDFLGY